MPPFADLPPYLISPPAYIRSEKSGLIVPDKKIVQAMIPGFSSGMMLAAGSTSRVLLEAGGTPGATSVADRGLTHISGENLAYVGIGYTTSSGSVSATSFTWDGASGDWFAGVVSNANSEGKGIGFSIINVGAADYSKAMSMGGSGTKAYAYVRIIGGVGPVTYVTHAGRANPGYPATYNLSVQKNDIIIAGGNLRNGGTSFAGSNMTALWLSGERNLYGAVAPSTGTFSTTLTSSGQSQQWVDMIAVFRPQL